MKAVSGPTGEGLRYARFQHFEESSSQESGPFQATEPWRINAVVRTAAIRVNFSLHLIPGFDSYLKPLHAYPGLLRETEVPRSFSTDRIYPQSSKGIPRRRKISRNPEYNNWRSR